MNVYHHSLVCAKRAVMPVNHSNFLIVHLAVQLTYVGKAVVLDLKLG